jgi:hypothetical protein
MAAGAVTMLRCWLLAASLCAGSGPAGLEGEAGGVLMWAACGGRGTASGAGRRREQQATGRWPRLLAW